MNKRIIDGEEYFETGTVTYKDKEYIELHSVDVLKPRKMFGEYIDGKFELVNDSDVVYALLILTAMCVLSLHGKLIMDYARC